MAFEIISGAAADVNDLVDALAANWEFDTEDTTSTYHSVTWGAVTISRDDSARLSIAKGSQVIFIPAHDASSSYTIYKASNALLMCVKYSGSVINGNSYCIVITRATSLSDGTSKEKLVLIDKCCYYQSNLYNIYAPGWASDTSYNTNFEIYAGQYKTSSVSTQVYPFVLPRNGYQADNAYHVAMSLQGPLLTQVTFGGETYAICYGLAIKEE
jgi:hypothetical protein